MTFDLWIVVGLAAQAMFSARMGLQWIATERRKTSTVPKAFWYLSLLGGILLLVYAVHRKDPVFILGQAFGSLVYVRNIMLWREMPVRAAEG